MQFERVEEVPIVAPPKPKPVREPVPVPSAADERIWQAVVAAAGGGEVPVTETAQ